MPFILCRLVTDARNSLEKGTSAVVVVPICEYTGREYSRDLVMRRLSA